MKSQKCKYCGRILSQSSVYSNSVWFDCVRCNDGNVFEDVAHAKLVRIAWKYRAMTRRKCEQCRYAVVGEACTHKGIGYGIECHFSSKHLPVSYEAQCPAWESRSEK